MSRDSDTQIANALAKGNEAQAMVARVRHWMQAKRVEIKQYPLPGESYHPQKKARLQDLEYTLDELEEIIGRNR